MLWEYTTSSWSFTFSYFESNVCSQRWRTLKSAAILLKAWNCSLTCSALLKSCNIGLITYFVFELSKFSFKGLLCEFPMSLFFSQIQISISCSFICSSVIGYLCYSAVRHIAVSQFTRIRVSKSNIHSIYNIQSLIIFNSNLCVLSGIHSLCTPGGQFFIYLIFHCWIILEKIIISINDVIIILTWMSHIQVPWTNNQH